LEKEPILKKAIKQMHKKISLKYWIILSTITIHLVCSSTITNRRLNSELDLQGHRGARGLKPENTIPAFEEALFWGMNTIELDTVVTKDKQLIIHHDTELNPQLCRHTEGKKVIVENISHFTVAELKKLDCGSLPNPKFPDQKLVPNTNLSTLQEFFQFIQNYEKKNKTTSKVNFNIETKFPNSTTPEEIQEFANLIVKEIEQAGMVDRTIVQSFRIEVLPLVKKLNPKIQTSALFAPTIVEGIRLYLGIGSSIQENILKQSEEVGANIISPYFLYVDAEFVQKAHKQNRKVIPWTVNDKKEMLRLQEIGVDGIISDYPNKLVEVLRAK
jgi:glycerophosphoryl diester phosphodiesterase